MILFVRRVRGKREKQSNLTGLKCEREMLIGLTIQNVVLIDHLELTLEKGLSVLTGETGAGKSIVLDALGLALGQRGDNALIREGERTASVTAVFDISRLPHAHDILIQAGLSLSEAQQVVCRRVLERDRTSRAFINDHPVTLSFMKSLGEVLVHIHGQFDAALTPAQQRQCLDVYGAHQAMLADVAAAYQALKDAETALEDAERHQQHARERQIFLSTVLDDLNTLAPVAGEEKSLSEERAIIANSARIVEGLYAMLAHCGSQTSGAAGANEGALPRLFEASKVMQKITGFGESIQQLALRLESTIRDLDDITVDAGHMAASLAKQHHRVQDLDDRLHRLRILARKYGCPADDLANYRDKAAEEIALFEHSDERLRTLSALVDQARDDYSKTAHALSLARRAAAHCLATGIMAEFPDLKLEHVKFEISVESLPESQWGACGADSILFTVRTNDASRASPLTDVASGGERSRIELALRVNMAASMGTPTLIFDEIDSGMGGAVAAAVGARLKKLAEIVQVVAITHSPQVAAYAKIHAQVCKGLVDDRVVTSVVFLDPEARREEIARMLAGTSLTDEARAAAERLLHGSQIPSQGASPVKLARG